MTKDKEEMKRDGEEKKLEQVAALVRQSTVASMVSIVLRNIGKSDLADMSLAVAEALLEQSQGIINTMEDK